METETRKPPDTLQLMWCPVCGGTDRYQVLRDRHRPKHYDSPTGTGGYCPGTPERVTYTPTSL